MNRNRTLVTGAITAMCGLSAVPVAEAGFPGTNGRIAFTSNLAGGLSEIYSMKPNGTNLRRLTRNKVGDFDAVYSASGRKIAFVRGVRAKSEIWTMNADGSRKRRLTRNTGEDGSPAWSPDGRRIVFRSTRVTAPETAPNLDVWVMNADGSGQTRLTSAPASDDDPVFSPDGTRIAFHSYRDRQAEIYLMNADGTDQRPLTATPADDVDADWSPTSRRIVFSSYRDGNGEIYIMNADGSNQRRVTRTPRANEALPVFSPSGGSIAFQRRLLTASGRIKRADDVFVMRTSGRRLRRLTRSRDVDGRPDWQPGPPRPRYVRRRGG
jgi:Tol biopolymer transport system component